MFVNSDMQSLIATPTVIPPSSTGDFATFNGKPPWSVPKTQLISEASVAASTGLSNIQQKPFTMSSIPNISTGPGPVFPPGFLDSLQQEVDKLKALTISLSVLQVVLTALPLICLIMELRGTSSYSLRVASLISLVLLFAASVVKLAFTADFWAKPSIRDIAPALLA